MPKPSSPLRALMLLGLADAAVALASPWLVSVVRLGFNTAVGLLIVTFVALILLIGVGLARIGRRAAWLSIYLPLVLFWPAAVAFGLWACSRTHCKMY